MYVFEPFGHFLPILWINPSGNTDSNWEDGGWWGGEGKFSILDGGGRIWGEDGRIWGENGNGRVLIILSYSFNASSIWIRFCKLWLNIPRNNLFNFETIVGFIKCLTLPRTYINEKPSPYESHVSNVFSNNSSWLIFDVGKYSIKSKKSFITISLMSGFTLLSI